MVILAMDMSLHHTFLCMPKHPSISSPVQSSPVQSPELHFCCRCGQRQNFPWLQWEQEQVSPSTPTPITICCFLCCCVFLSALSAPSDGAGGGGERCLHKGGNSSPGGSCLGSVAKALLLAPADLSSAALPALLAGCRWLSPQPFPLLCFLKPFSCGSLADGAAPALLSRTPEGAVMGQFTPSIIFKTLRGQLCKGSKLSH